MTPHDVPGPVVTAESLRPWLIAIAPAVEPVRTLPGPPAPADEPRPLRPAA